jgi:diacylglycerol kinase (ATP)
MEALRIFHIINQSSGPINQPDIGKVIEKTKQGDVNIEAHHRIYYLSGDDDEKKIRESLEEYKPDIVTAGGGDGTVNFVAGIIMNQPVKLGIIPMGSANGLAYELGIPEKVEDALKLILSGRTRPVDVIRINEKHISLHLSDIGINARIVKEFEKEGSRGFRGYVKHFFTMITKPLKIFRCEIIIEDNVYKHRAYMILLANASFYRSGANMNPTGFIDDGRFEIIVLRPYHRWFLRSLIGAFSGTLHRKPNVKTYDCTSAVIKISPPEELQVDGELLGKTAEINATICRHALNIILPRQQGKA